jgi:cytochrome c oxidase accessory protein FixG
MGLSEEAAGKFTNWRQWFGYALLAFLFIGPFIRIGGEPLLMINLVERRFVFFGQTFWPQDFLIFVLGFLTFIVFVALFTVAFGRLFCGWACPQTVFMEQVFRRIEYAIEGDWKQQQALNKGPYHHDKMGKKTVKHVLFFAISFLIGNTFLAYIIGSDELLRIVRADAAALGGLLAMGVFSGVFYGNFAFFREQACTTVCPYGRLQGVLLDRKSIVIAYDHVRGEARGCSARAKIASEVGKGDCIDCSACVHVCPTGIDIRNGTQLECVNCTACIDACDHMMTSVGLPTGLIRYASEEGDRGEEALHLQPPPEVLQRGAAGVGRRAGGADLHAVRRGRHRAAHTRGDVPSPSGRQVEQFVRHQSGEQDPIVTR